jgi:hypothetical protein
MIVRCHRSELELRCIERGYDLDEVISCVTRSECDWWYVDTSHPSYPSAARARKASEGVVFARRSHDRAALGPGTELKKLLAGWPFYITSTASCPCNAYARQMDEWGCDGCEERASEIVAHLRAQAESRGLPFIDAAGRFLVRRAIKNARKNQH